MPPVGSIESEIVPCVSVKGSRLAEPRSRATVGRAFRITSVGLDRDAFVNRRFAKPYREALFKAAALGLSLPASSSHCWSPVFLVIIGSSSSVFRA